MDNFLLSVEVVLPLFLMMALGYLLRRILELDDRWIELTNKVIFRALLPLLLFRNMYESDLSGMSAPGMAGVVFLCIGALTATFLALSLLVPRLEKENARRGVLIQGMFRGNAAIFGIPIATLLFGNDITAVVLLLACVVPLFNVFSIIALERYRSSELGPREILHEIVKNPLIIGILLGLALNALHIDLPSPVKSAAWGLADSTTPISFLALGASFTFASAAKNRRELTGAVLFKLVFLPLL
ncbi:MAG: AEC family transporter, partial [Bacillota bacterium]